ncbi:hypothetical protein SAMN04490189_0055 [Pseudomonas koreensis]|uniref:toll/interleukin-1 receptor domain-containing protein n=1 Tax=Pseudomonas koreensis TaxID=198620 RepID=UPI00087A23A6|nr:toll/interleukin-1 receptor domain-containing protein [Pseudomonas koreensis]KAB0514188.1 hypothetical protein F7R05_07975 [Pseudomonas koreensis]NNA62601.1 hypothetical protein [Pseudomonas koreensis]GGK47986.1 hypothetical protein GCM10009103_48120 [Pseudomonas koreensis]SDC60665.1 hypothetical protein SAMN04490189_0055 [Pseudomonas koreensis]
MYIDLKIEDVASLNVRWGREDIREYKDRNTKPLVDLKKYLLGKDNLLDASEIQKNLFPEFEVDVFISHSHSDESEAIKIALSLEAMGLRAFVDSCAWGYADELLREIDNKFCIPEGWSNYNYDLRNRTTTNVHLILNSALQQMIHKSELFIFLGTENSIRMNDYVADSEYLSSPWIFSELMFAKSVERTPRKRIFSANENYKFRTTASDQKEVGFRYLLPESSYSIGFQKFSNWLSVDVASNDRGFLSLAGLEHLDRLYRIVGVPGRLLDQSPRLVTER